MSAMGSNNRLRMSNGTEEYTQNQGTRVKIKKMCLTKARGAEVSGSPHEFQKFFMIIQSYDSQKTTVFSRKQPETNARRFRISGRMSRRGMTLVEVVIGFAVLATTCMAGLSGLLFAYRMSDSNLRALSASSAVRSIGEQLVAVDYATLFGPSLPVDVPSNPGGALATDTWNDRTDDVHNTPENPNDDLRMRINPTITRVRDANGLDYAQVVLTYEWVDSSFFSPRTKQDKYTLLIAPVSSF